MANTETPLADSSFNAPVESSKQNIPSKKCLYHRIPHPDQLPNFRFKEAPTSDVVEEEEIGGHFIETSSYKVSWNSNSWPNLLENKSNSKDFTETGWVDWVNQAQYLPEYEVSDDYRGLNPQDGPSKQREKLDISYSLYNVACARKILFALSHLPLVVLHGSIPLKNFCWSCETLLLLDVFVYAEIRKHICLALVQIPNILELHERINPILQTAESLFEEFEEAKKLDLEIVNSYVQFIFNDYLVIVADDASNDQLKICFKSFQMLAKNQVNFLSSQEFVLSKIQLPKMNLDEEMEL